MNDSATYRNYLRDLVFLLKERMHDLNSNTELEEGVKLGYCQTLETIASQAAAFGINEDEIGFNDYEKSTSKR